MSEPTPDKVYSWNATAYLKGIAILAVLLNHYINHYTSLPLGGFANGTIAVFFVLSGYGCFYSLERRTSGNKIELGTVSSFWLDRILRVVPLYLLALLAYNYIFGWETILWFIPYILTCYLAAPFAYYAAKKYRTPEFVAFVFAAFLLVNIFYFSLQPPEVFEILGVYRGMFLTHILLFCLGIGLPTLLQTELRRKMDWAGWLFAPPFLLLVLLTRGPVESITEALGAILLVISALLLVVAILSRRVRLPLESVVSYIGKESYSVYILHMMYYMILEHSGLLELNSVPGTILVVGLSPLFFILCRSTENISRRILSVNSQQKT